ncbi:SDR family NAD(P)-dependent oxidoreductase [Dickeya lacustris]|uniref:SDR family NAD(P)-dependent oxidoreductase n=1 Tax=Dickeya lacustris TaxID=2259638 RepID=A0ABY8G5D9_9GAMM|nr:SDR family NAD(P)-dependent oxidoreductase [Dickeya lacustris]WFN55160.1 SDR family NAD(P)-dependent oxidoreductase [Dickeya lacustris]
MRKVWFITGASRGFGRRFTEAALQRGDNVAATARTLGALADLTAVYGSALLPLALDVTDKTAVTAAVNQAHAHFGRLDVVVNNAGYGVFGMVEEISERDVRTQFDTNVLGPLWVTQAALPYLRAQRGGHIIMLSSLLGLASLPSTGIYSASKAAVEAFADALSQEVAAFGIHVTIVEPGPFSTDFSASAVHASPLASYEGMHSAVNASFTSMPIADPDIVGPALLKVVDADEPPLRIFFGPLASEVVPHIYSERLKLWQAWQDVGSGV